MALYLSWEVLLENKPHPKPALSLTVPSPILPQDSHPLPAAGRGRRSFGIMFHGLKRENKCIPKAGLSCACVGCEHQQRLGGFRS